jgi:hypothetical protein
LCASILSFFALPRGSPSCVQRGRGHRESPPGRRGRRPSTPGEDAFHRHDDILAVRGDRREEVFGRGRSVAVDQDRAPRVEHADVHPPGVQIDATVVSVRCRIEPYPGSSFPLAEGVSLGRDHLTATSGWWGMDESQHAPADRGSRCSPRPLSVRVSSDCPCRGDEHVSTFRRDLDNR